MLSIWRLQRFDLLSGKHNQVTRELNCLLQEQEKLLQFPMGTADMTLYEIRSDQIRALVAKLVPEADKCSNDTNPPESAALHYHRAAALRRAFDID